MPLWKNTDTAANSDIAALMQVQAPVNSANQSILYGNVTVGAFFDNVAVGQFGVDSNEMAALAQTSTAKPAHAGWVLRTEGTGLRAGRVTYETLVAMGSMTGDGNSIEDIYVPDYTIVITTQPTSNTTNVAKNLTFTVVSTSAPTGAALQYFWQYNNASGGQGWANVANTAGRYFNNTTPTFTANNKTANGNVFRVMVMTTGANTVYSSNASISYIV